MKARYKLNQEVSFHGKPIYYSGGYGGHSDYSGKIVEIILPNDNQAEHKYVVISNGVSKTIYESEIVYLEEEKKRLLKELKG